MLRFFRVIRKNLLTENRFSKYTAYAIGEIVLVVIGILIALEINNWNESRIEQQITHKYYAGLIADLKKDEAQLLELIEIRKQQLKSTREIISDIESRDLDLDRFYNNYYLLFTFARNIPTTNTLEEILNSSHLRFITDENIKNQLLNLRNSYEMIRLTEEHIYHDRQAYQYTHHTMENVEMTGFLDFMNNRKFSESKHADTYRQDALNFMDDRYFKSFMILLQANLIVLIPVKEDTLKEGQALIADLENALINEK